MALSPDEVRAKAAMLSEFPLITSPEGGDHWTYDNQVDLMAFHLGEAHLPVQACAQGLRL